MLFLNPKIVLFVLGSFLSLFPGSGIDRLNSGINPDKESASNAIDIPDHTNFNGYKAIIRYRDEFLAAGSDGRIDRISLSGKVTNAANFPAVNFNCLLSDNQTVIAAGNNGNVMIDPGTGIFHKTNSGTDKDINALALFDGAVIAGTDGGEILLGDPTGFAQIIPLDLKGNIVSVSAGSTYCYGVTDKGEIIHSTDGINWDIFDFNKEYAGFYKTCSFTNVLVTENRIAVAGINEDGSPAILFSTQGSVWTERDLNYTDDHGMEGYLEDLPSDIFYDESGDRFFVACSNGKLLVLPSCTQCNAISALTNEDLEGISGIDKTLMIVGENFFIKRVDIR